MGDSGSMPMDSHKYLRGSLHIDSAVNECVFFSFSVPLCRSFVLAWANVGNSRHFPDETPGRCAG